MSIPSDLPSRKRAVFKESSSVANQTCYAIVNPDGTNVGGASTVGGATYFFDSSADNTAQALKTSAGTLYGLDIYNPNSVWGFVQVFNVAAGSVTVGTTAPNIVFFVPPTGALTKDFPVGLSFATAITYACTTTATGSGALGTALTFSGIYK